jgi:hypothetical protein
MDVFKKLIKENRKFAEEELILKTGVEQTVKETRSANRS